VSGRDVFEVWRRAVSECTRKADSAFAVSTDERYILFTQIDQAGSDIEVMEHYRSE
jgi:hypothetical protein